MHCVHSYLHVVRNQLLDLAESSPFSGATMHLWTTAALHFHGRVCGPMDRLTELLVTAKNVTHE